MQYEDNTILITQPCIKKKILQDINDLKKIINIKIYTIDEFIQKYYFSYDELALYRVSKKYDIKPEIAKMYIDNLYYINENIQNEKIKHLNEILSYLQEEKLIKQNPLFINSLYNKKVIFVNIPQTKFNKRLEQSLEAFCQVELINLNSEKKYIHQVNHFNLLEDEVVFAANEICNLIKKGIDISKIFISNISEEHRLIITKIFELFHIPVTLNDNNYLYGTKICQKFITYYESDINNTFEKLKNELKNLEEETIYNQLISIVNKYYFVNDYLEVKDMIINELQKTKISISTNENSVKEVPFLDYLFEEDDYVFLFNFNQGCIPKIYKDENYLNDDIMSQLNLDTAPYLNKLEKERVINKIENIKNLFISYIDSSLSTFYYPSVIIEELNMEVIDYINDNYSNSHKYNKIKLSSMLTNYQKYNIIDKNLSLLYNNYKLDKYDNKFTGINHNNLYKFLDNKLNLSYTSLNNYYKCGFKYYVENILKLDIYEETFMQVIGSIFHEVLEKYFQYKEDFDILYQEAINHINYEYTIKDQFFLKKLKNELKFVIETIENQNNYTNLKEELYEEKIVVNIPGNISVKFSGIIDKLKYCHKNDKTIIAIIDYKTGNPELNLNNIIYGLDMQLPIYIYLAKHSDKLNNIEVAGFYLQKILNNEVIVDNKHTYEQLKKENLKLQGYSNSEFSIISEFDSSYQDSNVIKSLKVCSTGFYNYSKVLNNETINKMTDLIDEKINNGAKEILEAKFIINPKEIKEVNIGCKFCNYKDLCYMNEKNIIKLPKYENLEFLGRDNNEHLD